MGNCGPGNFDSDWALDFVADLSYTLDAELDKRAGNGRVEGPGPLDSRRPPGDPCRHGTEERWRKTAFSTFAKKPW